MQRFPGCVTYSKEMIGKEKLGIERFDLAIRMLGQESVTVPAGVFDSRHFEVLIEGLAAPFHIWTTGDDHILVPRAVGSDARRVFRAGGARVRLSSSGAVGTRSVGILEIHFQVDPVGIEQRHRAQPDDLPRCGTRNRPVCRWCDDHGLGADEARMTGIGIVALDHEDGFALAQLVAVLAGTSGDLVLEILQETDAADLGVFDLEDHEPTRRAIRGSGREASVDGQHVVVGDGQPKTSR